MSDRIGGPWWFGFLVFLVIAAIGLLVEQRLFLRNPPSPSGRRREVRKRQ